ncbi:MAG: acyl-CoA dehydrogenase family protein [Ilumatobacteraceae bacterium]
MRSASTNTPAGRSASDLLTGVRGMAELVTDLRDSFDEAARLPDVVFDHLSALGAFRMWLPTACGGPQLSALAFMEVVEAAAALDGTIGWLVGNGGGMSRCGAFLEADSAAAIFDDDSAFVVSATGAIGRAEHVDGGFVVSGRWPFGSGGSHGTWFAALCAVEGDGTPTDEIIFVYAPRIDVVLHDNWHVSGLLATGSVDFELRHVFVAERFTHAFQPTPRQAGTLYRLPTRSIFAWTVATVPLGLARGAVAEFVRIARTRQRRGQTPLAERELVQSQLGRVEARLSASRAYLTEAMEDLLAGVEAGADLEAARVAFRMACTYASQSALSAIDQVTQMAGAVAISRACTLERFERDARAAAKHIAMSPDAYVTGGMHMLGQELSNRAF